MPWTSEDVALGIPLPLLTLNHLRAEPKRMGFMHSHSESGYGQGQESSVFGGLYRTGECVWLGGEGYIINSAG